MEGFGCFYGCDWVVDMDVDVDVVSDEDWNWEEKDVVYIHDFVSLLQGSSSMTACYINQSIKRYASSHECEYAD